MRRLIGITGTIGSGKSSVCRFLAGYAGLPLIDIDQLCRDLLVVDQPGWQALQAKLEGSYFLPDGQLDRKKLRRAIFNDAGLRRDINTLIHPLAHERLQEEAALQSGPVLVDVPLLFEAGWQDYFSPTVMVFADAGTCCRRIAERDRITPDEAGKAVMAQMDPGEKAMLAEHVIDNRYCWLWTRLQTTHLAGLLTS